MRVGGRAVHCGFFHKGGEKWSKVCTQLIGG